MKAGADRKKVLILSGLGVVVVYVLWTNVFSGGDTSSANTHAHVVPGAPGTVLQPNAADTRRVLSRRGAQHRGGEFNPDIVPGKADPNNVDPTLRLDLLAKVQNVGVDSATPRNIFTFGDIPKPVDKTPLPTVAKINLGKDGKPIPVLPPGPVTPPPPPGPPPITLKYYGFTSPKSSGRKHAFFLDGEDIIVASEGDTVKRRYKLVKIGVNSVTLEDTQFNNHQQTVPLAPDLAG
jgi:hypothetical protein